MKWKVLESKYLHKIPWLTIREDKCELPNGNVISSFYVNEYPDWVNAVCLTKEGQVVMVRQYRHGLGTTEIELPGGVVEEGERHEEGVRREVLEETGYTFEKFEYLGKVSANPSTTNNYTHFYLATGGEKTAEPDLDHSEEIEVVLVTIAELKAMVRENRIMQSLHVNGILYALLQLGEISL